MTDPFEYSASPIELIGHIEATCERVTTPCGDGSMVWRLFEKGRASWSYFTAGQGRGGIGFDVLSHSSRRISLAHCRPAWTCDSDDAPPNYNPSIIGGVLADGVRELCSSIGPPHIAGSLEASPVVMPAQLGSFAAP